MRIIAFLTFLLLLVSLHNGLAQKPGDLAQSRILILLDESSSMAQKWSPGKERYKAAGELINRLLDSLYKVNDQVEFSLRVFGHQHTVPENDCFDTRNEVMFSKDNRTQMALRLADIRPLGVTPIAYSLQQAAEHDLTDEQRYAYSIILITDGGESCGGDICEVVKTLIQHKVYFKPYIISMVDYAPLKTEYACLGDYLQVTTEKEIPKAVGTIVEAYRPMLTLSKNEYKQIQTILAMPPSVLQVTIPPVTVPKAEEPPKPKPEPIVVQPKIPEQEKPKPVVLQPKPVEPEIKPLPKENIARLPYAHRVSLPPLPAPSYALQKVPVPGVPDHAPDPAPIIKETIDKIHQDHTVYTLTLSYPAIQNIRPHAIPTVPEHEPEPLPKENIAALKLMHARRMPLLFLADEGSVLRPYRVPDVPARAPDPIVTPPVAITPAPKPVVKLPTPKPKPVVKTPTKSGKQPIQGLTVPYKLQVEDAKETTVEVYFTDDKGTFYSTTPEVNLYTPSGDLVKKFYRSVDASGNPDPRRDIPVGTYNLSITGKTNLILYDVQILPNKKNKIVVRVSNGSLRFEYIDNPNRPVKEYEAMVMQRAESGGKTTKQKCTEELPYPAGNYHVRVNTLPVSVFNVDLEFSSEFTYYIPEPGYIQFTNQNRLGRAKLYTVLGDEYVMFWQVDITGNPPSQKVELKPGPYKVHFQKDPNKPNEREKIIDFRVNSNETTSVELN